MPQFVKTKVAIIVTSYKDKPFLELCVDSIYLNTPRNLFELVVASDVSDEETMAYIRELGEAGWCHPLFAQQRSWFTGTNNMGLRWALAQDPPFTHFLLLNSDTYVLPGWLEGILFTAYELDCGIVGCKTVTGDGRIDHAGAYGPGYHYGIRQDEMGYWESRVCRTGHEWVTGACFLIRRDVLETIGLLDEVQNPHIGSDRGYCYTAQAAGFRVGWSPAAIYHFTLSHQKEGQ